MIMAKKKKIKLPEEIQKVVDKVKEKEAKEYHEIIKEAKQTLNKNRPWDVLCNEPILFFDPTLSYELTGYKPITNKQGLDFDPNWFTEDR